jgi:hypothetical protein
MPRDRRASAQASVNIQLPRIIRGIESASCRVRSAPLLQRRFGVKLQLYGQDKVLQRVGSLVLMTVDEE